jgi:uncharacterized Zn finger protein (UPF0148 family)
MPSVSRCRDCGAPQAVYDGETYCPSCENYEPTDPTVRVLIVDLSGPDPTAELALRDIAALHAESDGCDPTADRMAKIARAALRRIDAGRPSQARPSEGA